MLDDRYLCDYLRKPTRSRTDFLRSKRFEIACEYCNGTGKYHAASSAPWRLGREMPCEACDGEGSVEYAPEVAFEEACGRWRHSRNLFHINWRGNRIIAWNHHADAEAMLTIAKQARDVLRELGEW